MVEAVPKPAKITRPKLSVVYPRKRLFRLLDDFRKRPVTWVVAPPGAGKTTAVASYLGVRKLPHVWYRIDEGDTDPASFFYHMGLAAQAAFGLRNKFPLLGAGCEQELLAFTRNFFGEVYRRLRSPFVMVFDDHHVMPVDSEFQLILRAALLDLPEGVNVIVTSRRTPPSALARLRASDSMAVMDWDHLRLTTEEVTGVLKAHGNSGVSTETASRLMEDSQGWVAGLVLLLRSKAAVPPRVSNFEPELVFDYFAGEIFDAADPRLQEFLVQIAYLPTITPQSAKELTGCERAAAILADLDRNNCFITRHQTTQHVAYRFHALFRRFLLSRAESLLTPHRHVKIKRQAAQSLELNDEIDAAADLLVDLKDWESLVGMIMRQAEALVEQGRYQTLERWLRALPANAVDDHGWLSYWHAVCRFAVDPAGSLRQFEQAFRLFRIKDERDGLFMSWAYAVLAIQADLSGRVERLEQWIELLEEILTRSSEFPSAEIELLVAKSMYVTLAWRGSDHPRLDTWRERCEDLLHSMSPTSRVVEIGSNIVVQDLILGEQLKAKITLAAITETARERRLSPQAEVALRTAQAFAAWRTGLIGEAIDHAENGLRICRDAGICTAAYRLRNNGMAAALSDADVVTASGLLEQDPSGTRRGIAGSFSENVLAWHAFVKRDIPDALQHARRSLELAANMGNPYLEALAQFGLANTLWASGEHEAAQPALHRALGIAERIGSDLVKFASLLLRAHFGFQKGKRADGLAHLRSALEIGRQRCYYNFLWWRPSVMSELCATALESDIESSYVRELVCRRGLKPAAPSLTVAAWPWPLKVQTFGTFRIWVEGEPADFGRKSPKKALSLLKAIIAFGGRDVTEHQLTDTLWPDADADAVHDTLGMLLNRLRKLLGQDVITLREGKFTLNTQRCWVDAWAFESSLTKANEALTHDEQEHSVDLLQKALNLYAGAFLTSDMDQPWTMAVRERLRGKYVRHLCRLVDHHEQEGAWDRAIGLCIKGLEVDLLAEPFYRSLMRCYLHTDRKAEAAEVYQRCQRKLLNNLGVEPSAATKAIYRALRQP